jgi:hypothetical protein
MRVAVQWGYIAASDIAASDAQYESAAKILRTLTR